MVFDSILKMFEFDDVETNLTNNNDKNTGLWNPTSPACCMIIWLYSIEPPFYSYVNEAVRTDDLETL